MAETARFTSSQNWLLLDLGMQKLLCASSCLFHWQLLNLVTRGLICLPHYPSKFSCAVRSVVRCVLDWIF
jgi:hypothetical protein